MDLAGGAGGVRTVYNCFGHGPASAPRESQNYGELGACFLSYLSILKIFEKPFTGVGRSELSLDVSILGLEDDSAIVEVFRRQAHRRHRDQH